MNANPKRVLLKQLHDAVVDMDVEKTLILCQEALAIGIDAYTAIMEDLAAGMDTVGRLYEEKEYFVPELLLCSDAMYAGLEVLRPHVNVGEHAAAGGSSWGWWKETYTTSGRPGSTPCSRRPDGKP